jgi:hypothetical protein
MQASIAGDGIVLANRVLADGREHAVGLVQRLVVSNLQQIISLNGIAAKTIFFLLRNHGTNLWPFSA